MNPTPNATIHLRSMAPVPSSAAAHRTTRDDHTRRRGSAASGIGTAIGRTAMHPTRVSNPVTEAEDLRSGHSALVINGTMREARANRYCRDRSLSDCAPTNPTNGVAGMSRGGDGNVSCWIESLRMPSWRNPITRSWSSRELGLISGEWARASSRTMPAAASIRPHCQSFSRHVQLKKPANRANGLPASLASGVT